MSTNLINKAALALAIGSLAACAAAAPGGPGNPDDPNNPDNPDDVRNLKIGGKYELQSKFDIAANMPGTAGAVINNIIAATDGSDDPANWIVNQVLNQLPNGSVKNALQQSVPLVSGYLNDRLLELAPEFIGKMKTVGNVLGDITKNFGTISELNISGAPSSLTAIHTITGVQFKIDGNEIPYLFADYASQPIVINNVGITLDQAGKLAVASHKVPISYGKVVRIALDEAVLPLVDPQARNLNELFANLVDCEQVGIKIAEKVGIGSPSLYQGACTGGLTFGANFIYSQIEQINGSALEFDLAGSAKAIDKTRDDMVDELQRGGWTGTTSYAGTSAPMGTATFLGEKQ